MIIPEVANSMDVMLDLETCGVNPGCAILSIGACSFDGKHEFYQTISLSSSLGWNLEQEPDTIRWWDRQDLLVREEAFSGTESLINSLGMFHDWYRKLPAKNIFIWSNGADFDIPILTAAYKAVKMMTPWKIYNGRCYRTLKNLYPGVVLERDKGVKHNALDDAQYQALHANMLLKEHFRRSYK